MVVNSKFVSMYYPCRGWTAQTSGPKDRLSRAEKTAVIICDPNARRNIMQESGKWECERSGEDLKVPRDEAQSLNHIVIEYDRTEYHSSRDVHTSYMTRIKLLLLDGKRAQEGLITLHKGCSYRYAP
jgi:hypothetical protein